MHFNFSPHSFCLSEGYIDNDNTNNLITDKFVFKVPDSVGLS